MTLPDFLSRDPYGEILLAGHRIGLQHVVHYYNEGYSPEMLVAQYPTLPLSLIHKVIGFYLENRAEVNTYAEVCRVDMESQRAAGRHPNWMLLQERLGKQPAATEAASGT